MDSLAKMNEKKIAPKGAFFFSLNISNINDADYEHAKQDWNTVNLRTMMAYHELYMMSMSEFNTPSLTLYRSLFDYLFLTNIHRSLFTYSYFAVLTAFLNGSMFPTFLHLLVYMVKLSLVLMLLICFR